MLLGVGERRCVQRDLRRHHDLARRDFDVLRNKTACFCFFHGSNLLSWEKAQLIPNMYHGSGSSGTLLSPGSRFLWDWGSTGHGLAPCLAGGPVVTIPTEPCTSTANTWAVQFSYSCFGLTYVQYCIQRLDPLGMCGSQLNCW